MGLPFVESTKKHFENNNRIRDLSAHTSKVHSVDWNCDGRRLASGSFDKTVSLFALQTQSSDRLTKEHTFKGHSDSVDQLCWHPTNGDLLATASLDRTVRLWDARSTKCVNTVQTKGENINICWSPDGHTIGVGNKEDLVTFIDTRTHKTRCEQQFKFEVNEISWNNDNDLFFLTSGQGHVHVLSYPALKAEMVLNAHPATCICIEFDPSGRYFAVGSADAMVSIFDANHLVCLRTISRLEWPARTISFSFDGQLLASASEDLVIDICYVETGERVAEIVTEAPTFTVAFHPKRYLLAFACDDKDSYQRDTGIVKVWGFSNNS